MSKEIQHGWLYSLLKNLDCIMYQWTIKQNLNTFGFSQKISRSSHLVKNLNQEQLFSFFQETTVCFRDAFIIKFESGKQKTKQNQSNKQANKNFMGSLLNILNLLWIYYVPLCPLIFMNILQWTIKNEEFK